MVQLLQSGFDGDGDAADPQPAATALKAHHHWEH
jgi:hypothetical protein